MQHAFTQIILALMNRFVRGPAVAGRFQRAGRIILALISLWFVLAAAIWGQEGEKIITVFAAIARGVPAWVLVLPLAGLLSLLLLWRNPPGLAWLLGYGGILFIVIAFAVTIATDDAKVVGVSWGPAVGIAISFIYPMVAVVMAYGEPVSLDSPMVHLAYLGIVGHLRSLYRLAEKWHWPATGPQGPLHAVHLSGRWGERDMIIASGTRFGFNTADSFHFLQVGVTMARPPRPFYVAVGNDVQAPGKAEKALALSGTCQTSGRKAVPFYIWVVNKAGTEQAGMPRLRTVLDGGRRFLRNQTVVRSADNGLVFERRSIWRMTEKEDDIEAILRWLSEMARTMEEGGLTSDAGGTGSAPVSALAAPLSPG